MGYLRKILSMKHVGADLDNPETTDVIHHALIREKYYLRKFYDNAYRFFKEQRPVDVEGDEIELGSGGGYLKDVLPEVITSDVLELEGVDRVLSAFDLPFDDASMKAIYMMDVFHHLQKPREFLAEAQRVLKPGGRIIMLEPANTLWGQFIYQNFHHEPFDPSRSEWELPEGGAMSMANGALPWIVFKRDVETFNREFPELKKVLMRDVHPLLYLISGGVSMKQLLPQWASPLLSTTEYLLSPLNPLLGMFSHIVIEKTGAGKEI